ncbi:hypothetical protein Dform_00145 [Dehalogenimonas formicexedens]|uniref:Uncharacterized protein n=1 Tax=Dehalogenimonas formicexedens TaxID=1839801 RepID=A0A1P8F504_9CHLR|nr:hypothetical protein [Dehalogenimonas formicexedens]APV43508.1 hypothetical protein Dform_00145 [Dehalogenimonas formicexedens]
MPIGPTEIIVLIVAWAIPIALAVMLVQSYFLLKNQAKQLKDLQSDLTQVKQQVESLESKIGKG